MLLGMLPVAISTAWGVSYLVAGSFRRHSLAAVGMIVATATISAPATVAVAAYVASGLTLGWTLSRRLRFDAVLAAGLLPMVLVVVTTLAPVSSEDLLTEYGRNLTEALRQSLPTGGDEAARQTLIDEYERVITSTTRLLVQIWPAVIFAGLVGEVGLVMVLVRWLAILAAKHLGVRMVINTDAHHLDQLHLIRFGISQARRGWAEKQDIINTWPVGELLKMMK